MPGGGGYMGGGTPDPVTVGGTVEAGEISSGAVLSGHIASGQVGQFHMASGRLTWSNLGSGTIQSGHVASGQLGQFHMASGQLTWSNLGSGTIRSGHIASGSIGRYHLTSILVVDLLPCEQAISGLIAVAWGSGANAVVPAERHSSLRMPAIGVVVGNYVSGDIVPVISKGPVYSTNSGTFASGGNARFLYVGSGGLLINQSGFMDGASSGLGAAPTIATSGGSGILVQRLAQAISGGIYVNIGEMTSGLFSGGLGQW